MVVLPISDIRRTMTSLVFLCFWLSASATGGQIFSEVKVISESLSADGEGRLMKLRTCNGGFMVQCEPCEVIHIVNVSYAASQLQYRNPIQGCSDLTFQQEFDCRLPAKSQYIEAITERCDGIQSCQLTRETSDVSCCHPSKTWSCCLEIYYTCEPKSDLIHIVQFSANDFYGNVNNVSLQCQSLDLYVDSAIWVFNSAGEINNGESCYRVSPNTLNLKRRCERRGCSGVLVHGARGCGENENVFNNGLYVCYICKGSKVLKTTNVTPSHGKATTTKPLEPTESVSLIAASSTVKSATRIRSLAINEPTTISHTCIVSVAASSTSEPSTMTEYRETTRKSSSTSQSSSHISSATSETKWAIEVDMRVIVGVSPLFGVLLCLLIGCICCTKVFRRKNRVLGSRGLTRRQSRKKAYSYPEMSAFHMPLKAAGKRKVSEVDDAERILENKSENVNRLPIKQQASLVCKGPLGVQDKGEGTNTFDSSSSRLAGFQSMKGAEPARESQASVEELDGYSYPDMSPPIYLHDARKDQEPEVSSRAADADESLLESESKHVDRDKTKQRVSTVCKVSPRVRYKLEKTLIYDSNSNSNELTDYGTYLEFDADDVYEEGVGKGLEPACAEQKEFKRSLEPIADVTKKSNPDSVNDEICREEPTTAYDTLDFSCMSPVYEELNLETIDEYPVNIDY